MSSKLEELEGKGRAIWGIVLIAWPVLRALGEYLGFPLPSLGGLGLGLELTSQAAGTAMLATAKPLPAPKALKGKRSKK